MATHLIVYGHGAGDPGAVGNGTNERDFTRKTLHSHIKKYTDKSKDTFVFYDTTGNKDLFQETANGFGVYSMKASTYASVTEIHLDAASATATGGHNIVHKGLKADSNDLSLAQAIKTIVGWWGSVVATKGISYRDNLLNLNVCKSKGINYRLMELGFITNSSDMAKIKNNLDKYGRLIVEGITGESFETQTSKASYLEFTKPIRVKALKDIIVYHDKERTNKSTILYKAGSVFILDEYVTIPNRVPVGKPRAGGFVTINTDYVKAL